MIFPLFFQPFGTTEWEVVATNLDQCTKGIEPENCKWCGIARPWFPAASAESISTPVPVRVATPATPRWAPTATPIPCIPHPCIPSSKKFRSLKWPPWPPVQTLLLRRCSSRTASPCLPPPITARVFLPKGRSLPNKQTPARGVSSGRSAPPPTRVTG